ncbi:MAG: DUF362 domain-containing protein [Proteobacteria bacterium]|nr:DUF362 domain-containing protein [Pseudomonadota bacterium]MBU1742594.1 DUF362 domain-containing protein [Pseudomonadota bacterium]
MNVVTLAHTADRTAGVQTALAALNLDSDDNPIKGRKILLKPNYNTADPAPGSTDNETLISLIDELWGLGAASITIGERSWQSTAQVLEQKGILPLLQEKDVTVIIFDDLPQSDWIEIKKPGHHWPHGFRVARPVLEAESVVETCCLKTHAYGGVFTMSLKLGVGCLPGQGQMPQYMSALHASAHQRLMIAEINTAFSPDLIVLDGVDAFVDGGPMTGERKKGAVMLAATNRVALDAVGLACLKRLGANRAIMDTPIFEQEQIARAVELGLGPGSPVDIDLRAADQAGALYRDQVATILAQG